jgi:hypothetical protein
VSNTYLTRQWNGHQLRVGALRDYVFFTLALARSQWPSLVLFSLGALHILG